MCAWTRRLAGYWMWCYVPEATSFAEEAIGDSAKNQSSSINNVFLFLEKQMRCSTHQIEHRGSRKKSSLSWAPNARPSSNRYSSNSSISIWTIRFISSFWVSGEWRPEPEDEDEDEERTRDEAEMRSHRKVFGDSSSRASARQTGICVLQSPLRRTISQSGKL
jgi:hypothetical protein